jgi:transposase
MIGVIMYHRIRSFKGKLSVRETAETLGLSAGTVQKYFNMELPEASDRLLSPSRDRKSQFDVASFFIEGVLEAYPSISAEVLLRKVKSQYPEITGKIRAFRSFLKPYRAKFKSVPFRYFHPVKTFKESGQMQVDLGEITIDYSNFDFKVKIYFVVFVFSYSRMMFVSYQDRAYKTEDFIKAHLEAFRYFGHVPNECVYDQTKLVVISEKYREVVFNEKFHQFALKCQFTPVICEGYDPESKGKVERSIGYVKSSFLRCESFSDLEDLRRSSLIWLNEIANCRIHGTTGRRPDEMFEEEKPYLNKDFYLRYNEQHVSVDKTGLISYKGNKYSVPYPYQRQKVSINVHEGRLYCNDIVSGQQIAEHTISYERYKSIIDPNHYISASEKLAKAEQEVMSAFLDIAVDTTFVSSLIQRIKEDNRNYARQQLLGLARIAYKYPCKCWMDIESVVFTMPKIKISVLVRLLDISFNSIDIDDLVMDEYHVCDSPATSSLDRSLDVYMKKIKGGRYA